MYDFYGSPEKQVVAGRAGCSTRCGVMASHLENTYTDRNRKVSLPVTEDAALSTMTIPLYATMTDEAQSWVLESLSEELGAT